MNPAKQSPNSHPSASPSDSMSVSAATAPDTAATRPQSLPRLEPGVVVKHYEIIRDLGAGGMGMVFLARDTRLGRLVAIKFLLEHSGKAAQRFLVEARTTALCRHENIVVVYDVDEIHEHPYMVLEYIEGRTLRAVMAEYTADRAQAAIDCLLPVVRALVCAHGMGIVHRDLKPENILLANNGPVKVLDFGIAKQVVAELAQTLANARSAIRDNAALTQDGAIVGTMPYMAPEQWLEQPIDARTDLWAAGIILFELATGAHPLQPLTLSELLTVQDLDTPMPSAHDKLPGAPKLADIIDQCLRKQKKERFATATALVAALEQIGADKRTIAVPEDDDPYAGLSAFQESDAARFYGRDHDIAAVIGRLRNQQLVAIAGSSGAGKSSFVRAGVIPALKRAGKQVETFIVRPGRFPLTALADVLAFFADTSAENATAPEADPETLAETLRTQPGSLGARLRARCRRRGNDHRILLFVDQLEELYTLGIAPKERTAFYACLEGVADDASSPLRVIVTIRADFLDRITEDRRFSDELTRGLYFLPPMSQAGLRDALIKPLEAVQFRFEDDALVDEMMAGIEGTKSPLPILQFAATKLWEARDKEKRLVTREAYRALGGVAGALSTHADAVLAGMSAQERRLARAIFLRLVTTERTRAIVPMDELAALDENAGVVELAVQNLASARLLTIETSGERGGKTVELAHESLSERWAKLKQWLDESEQDAQFLSELRNAAQQWEKSGEAEGFLWRDQAAMDAGRWLARRRDATGAEGIVGLAKRDERYLDAVVTLAHRTQRRQRLGAIVLFAAISGIALAVSVLAIRAREQARRADEQAGRADEQARRADEQAAKAQEEALSARNATRIAAARELQGDPTTVLALLREVEGSQGPARWSELARWALHAGVSPAVLSHPEGLLYAEFSPEGKRIATVCADNLVRIWRADGSGEPVVLRGHEALVRTLSWSPDGARVATASDDRTARIWRGDGRGEPIVLRGHEDMVRLATWSPDGKRFVTVSLDKTARFWNGDGTGEAIVLRGHDGPIRSGAWSPDSKRFVTVSFDKTARIWNGDGSGEPVVLSGHEGIVRTAAWSPDGTRIVTASMDQTARIWNIDGTGKALFFRHDGQILSALFSPDGTRFVTASADKTARVWRADGTGEPVILRGHENGVISAYFTAGGERIVTASVDSTVRIWPVDGKGPVQILRGHQHDINWMAQSLDGKRVVTASMDNTARVWDLDGTGEPEIIGFHEDQVGTAAWSPDGKRIVSASSDKTARFWSVDRKSLPIVLRGHDAGVLSAAWSPDGAFVATTALDATTRVWKADGQGEPTILRGHTRTAQNVAFSPNGKHIVTVSDDTTARIWNADGTGEPIVLRGHDGQVFAAAWSPDGARIATASGDATVRIWNADGHGDATILRGHEGLLVGVAWSPDGKRIASASSNGTGRIWNADGTGEPIVLRGHEGSLSAIGWSPDGKQILTSAADHSIRIWNADGSGEFLVLRAAAPMNSASFSPDGQRIVAASSDNSVTIWSDLEPLHGSADRRLWSATTYCIPIERRVRILGVSETAARAQQVSCLQRVAEVGRAP